MDRDSNLSRFARLTYEKFRKLAADPKNSKYEKIGAPNEYREGFEDFIFEDICQKLPRFSKSNLRVLDIGPGCSDLAHKIIHHASALSHSLTLIDSPEMLAHLPDLPHVKKIPGRFPNELKSFIEEHKGFFDVILCYSVFMYIFAEGDREEFLNASLSMLAHEGQMLIGDNPNFSKRKRFFESPQGIKYHQNFTNTQEMPPTMIRDSQVEVLDDDVLLGMIKQIRSSGFDAYLMPQPERLPFSNRREDILIIRP